MAKSFVKSAGILALSVILAKVLGAVYRIPLTSIVGAEGMGLYQYVYPVFALLLTLSSGAVPNAIGITVSERVSVGDEEGAKKAFAVAMKLCLIIGSVGTAILAAIAYPLSLLQSEDAFIGHLSIAPAIFIVTLISAYRGWFMGHNDLRPSSLSQLTEGIVKLAVGLGLAAFLSRYGIRYAVAGALLGVVASEAVTLLIMSVTFGVKEKRTVKVKLREEKDTIKRLKEVAFPLVLCGMILPVSQFTDSLLVANLLKWGGYENPTATYGLWSGVVTPLINLPVMICITLGIAVTPQMVEGRQKRDVDFILEKANTVNKLTFFMGVPFTFLYVFMAQGIVGTLYPRLQESDISLAVEILRISAPSVLGLSVFQIYSAMLQGLGRAKVPLKIMATCMGVKLLLTVVLTPIVGIKGSAISSVVGYVGSGVWITAYFGYFAKLDAEYVKNAGLICLCGVIMSTVLFLCTALQTSVLAVVGIGAVAATTYILSVLLLKVFKKEELMSLPLSKVWLKLDEKINGENK